MMPSIGYRDMVTLHVVYDGDCPFCRSYVSLLRLREQYDVHLVDARQEPAFAAQYGLDLNAGMVVELDGKVFHGADAISLLSRLSWIPGPLSSKRFSRFVYPILRLGRNIALRVLRRSPL
jgi:predicted DCC family thiol-disulfide oxidoreductase YuxK